MVEPALLVMRWVGLIRKRFIEKGALSSNTALTLNELGLHKRLVFHIMLLKGTIIEIHDKYYFDNKNWDDSMAKKLNEFAVSFLKDIEQDDEEVNKDDQDTHEN